MQVNIQDILTITLVLFAIIDIPGSIPILVGIRAKTGDLHAGQAALFSGFLMISFLFVGNAILNIIGIDVASFSIAGALVIFIIGIEMILGVELFKHGEQGTKSASIVPIAFPLLAGSGTLTTILSMKAEYNDANIIIAILINLIVIYIALRFVPLIERKLGPTGLDILRRVFGVILLAIAIKLFSANIFQLIEDLRTGVGSGH